MMNRVCVIPLSKKNSYNSLPIILDDNMAGTFSATAADWKENYKHSTETELLKKKSETAS